MPATRLAARSRVSGVRASVSGNTLVGMAEFRKTKTCAIIEQNTVAFDLLEDNRYAPAPARVSSGTSPRTNGTSRVGTPMSALSAAAAVAFARLIFPGLRASDFPDVLIRALQTVATFNLHAFVLYPKDDRPRFLHHNLTTVTSQKVLDTYTSGTYVLDAVYVACRSGVASGLYRMLDLAPDAFTESEYYQSSDLHPCVSDEIGSVAEEIDFIARLHDGSCLVLALMRAKNDTRFDEEQFANLTLLEPLVRDAMSAQWTPRDVPAAPQASRPDRQLERAFFEFAKDRLSSREQTVVGLLLRGHSTQSTAHTLNIAEGTVKVHRKNIYDKLAVSSQAQLFLMFCTHLLADR